MVQGLNNVLRSGTHCNRQYKLGIVHDKHFCGYVKTTSLSYEQVKNIAIHDRVTYGPDEDGWIGFNCSHAGDWCVYEGEIIGEVFSKNNKWTVDRVEKECKKLCKIVHNMERS